MKIKSFFILTAFLAVSFSCIAQQQQAFKNRKMRGREAKVRKSTFLIDVSPFLASSFNGAPLSEQKVQLGVRRLFKNKYNAYTIGLTYQQAAHQLAVGLDSTVHHMDLRLGYERHVGEEGIQFHYGGELVLGDRWSAVRGTQRFDYHAIKVALQPMAGVVLVLSKRVDFGVQLGVHLPVYYDLEPQELVLLPNEGIQGVARINAGFRF